MSPRLLRLARKVAKRSQHHLHHMSAILMRGGAVVAAAANGARHRGHAEARALRPHMDARGCHLIIMRTNGNARALPAAKPAGPGGFGCSRPCVRCIKKIQDSGIDRVSFVDADGLWKTLSPSEL